MSSPAERTRSTRKPSRRCSPITSVRREHLAVTLAARKRGGDPGCINRSGPERCLPRRDTARGSERITSLYAGNARTEWFPAESQQDTDPIRGRTRPPACARITGEPDGSKRAKKGHIGPSLRYVGIPSGKLGTG